MNDSRDEAGYAARVKICRSCQILALLEPLEQVLDSGRNVAPGRSNGCVGRGVEAATVEVSDGLVAFSIPQFGRTIESLVDSAPCYAGDEPTVVVRARETDGATHIEVIDDGPGIPDTERGPVFDGTDITQLEHTSGVGLWLSRWTAEGCDGRLEYERTADSHTVVRVVLPAAEPVDTTQSDGP